MSKARAGTAQTETPVACGCSKCSVPIRAGQLRIMRFAPAITRVIRERGQKGEPFFCSGCANRVPMSRRKEARADTAEVTVFRGDSHRWAHHHYFENVTVGPALFSVSLTTAKRYLLNDTLLAKLDRAERRARIVLQP